MTRDDITEIRALVRRLCERTTALRARSGRDPVVRRLVNDVERIAIDLDELDDHFGPVPRQREDVVIVSDTPYDPALWHGADDEGVGGHRPHYY
ncbi:hypothetical protein [Lentzea aerocolonigenes]|jgi:hypothetical protein|uniref:hypothetical protein n=1 Tax=Lentzea aerocolonigenes TaxID=68170 RepID=UPI0004C2B6CF|nr:hypothetical protein [Lentzea aerocolonigenes]MCP2241544.1 hypothetical protein [Lentzea aerocolonigenes]